MQQDEESTTIVGCGMRFFKIMVIEIAAEEANSLERYNVELLFNSSQNRRHLCPYCSDQRQALLVLEKSLIVGHSNTMSYSGILMQCFEQSVVKTEYKI